MTIPTLRPHMKHLNLNKTFGRPNNMTAKMEKTLAQHKIG